MSNELLDKVRERAARRVAEAPVLTARATEWVQDAIYALLADVETALVLARREGLLHGIEHGHCYRITPEAYARLLYPLPARTRQVLREEPVPNGQADWLRYRWHEGQLQSQGTRGDPWYAAYVEPSDFALMRHALDLHDNPYRTEQVPGYESNPWGE